MTRGEETAIVRFWGRWSVGRKLNNAAYADFLAEMTARLPTLRHISVFEVLDCVVNAEPDARAGRGMLRQAG